MCKVRVAMLSLWLGCCYSAIAGNSDFTVDIDVLVKSGDPSPDGNGVFSNEFSLPPVLNNNGEVLLWARLLATIDPGADDDFAFFRSDRQSITTIARGGDISATGNPLQLGINSISNGLGTLRMYAIGANGLVTYAAPDNAGQFAIYQSNGQQTNVLLQNGQNTSFGNNVDISNGIQTLQFNDQGQMILSVFADTALGNDTPLFVRIDQNVEHIVYQPGQPLADGREIQLGAFLFLSSGASGLNNLGQVSSLLVTGASIIESGIYAGDSQTKILHTGEPAVDGLGTFSNTIGLPVTPLTEINDQDQVLVLHAVDDITTDYVGLYFYDGMQLVEWARTGDTTFGGPLVNFGVNFDLNNNGSAAYRIVSGDPIAVDRIVLRLSTGEQQLVVTDFTQLPSPIDLEVRGPFSLFLNDNDQVLFEGFVIAENSSRAALLFYDPDEGLALVTRVGAPLRGDTIASFDLATSIFPLSNRYRNNATNPFNDRGEVVFSYTLNNGESGVALARVEFIDENLLLRDGFENTQ